MTALTARWELIVRAARAIERRAEKLVKEAT